MKLTVLGRWAPFPAPGGACPGYLLEAGDTRVLMDCGSGVLARLTTYCSYGDLDAVILTHLHGDHISDTLVLRYAIDSAIRFGTRRGPLAVYAPAEPAEEFRRLAYKDALAVQAVAHAGQVRVGEIDFRFVAVEHALPCLGLTAVAGDARFAYSGDTAYTPALVDLARGADLFLCEATFQEKDQALNVTGHLTAREAALAAVTSGARALVLTHLWPGYNHEDTLREARELFPDTRLAEEGLVLAVRGR